VVFVGFYLSVFVVGVVVEEKKQRGEFVVEVGLVDCGCGEINEFEG
jgi:hypothetical protein